jgi:hypothetical protein
MDVMWYFLFFGAQNLLFYLSDANGFKCSNNVKHSEGLQVGVTDR